MPVQSCQLNGKPGFRWGSQGKCFTYTPRNQKSRSAARKKATDQGRAIRAAGERS